MELLASRYQTIPLYSSQNCLSDFCSLLLFTCQCASSNMRLIRFFRSWSGSHVAISYSSSPSSCMECPSVSNAGSWASPVDIEYLRKLEHISIKIAGVVCLMVCLSELDQRAVSSTALGWHESWSMSEPQNECIHMKEFNSQTWYMVSSTKLLFNGKK